MASDWIRIRRGIRQLPKTVALARHLSHNPEFMAWWSDPVRMSCRHSVTEIVTFENVTRVTACALTELWFALNDVVGGDCWVPYMAVSDIDDIVGVPGFGDALVAVGWVTLHDEKGLVFPNFSEHNVPQKMRSEPKSDAQRAKEYRERKRGGERVTKRHGASRPEDKSREEEYIPAAPVPTSKPAARSRAKSAVSWTAADGWQGITDGDRQEWAAAYPGAVLDQELAKATAWLKANPSRAGRRNWRAFVVRWLSRCQDQGGTNRSPGRTPGDADKRAALDRKAREFAGLSPAAYRTPKQVAALAAGLKLKEEDL